MLREKTIFIKLTKIIFTKSTKISKRKLNRMVIFALLCSSINFVNNTYAKERSICLLYTSFPKKCTSHNVSLNISYINLSKNMMHNHKAT